MLKLIQLEWKKHTVFKYICNAVIITAVLLGLLFLIASDPGTGKIVAQTGKSEIHSLTDMFMNMAYLVFTGAMLSTFVIGEYENKLIQLMFSYPIKRQKIILSKVLAVCIFSFTALILSKLIAYIMLTTIKSAPETSIYMGELSFWAGMLTSAAASICSGCFAMLIGMKMKSSKAALISSFVIMLIVLGVTQGNILPCTSFGPAAAYIVQTAGAIAAIFISIWNVEREDVK